MNKLQLLIQMIDVSEGVRHSKKQRHKNNLDERKADKHKHKNKCKLSFTAKKTLCILLSAENINQRNISKKLNVSSQAISEVLKNLESKNIIKRIQGDLNNENWIILTDEGKVIATEAKEKMNAKANNLFYDFDDNEMETLNLLLEKIQNNMNFDK